MNTKGKVTQGQKNTCFTFTINPRVSIPCTINLTDGHVLDVTGHTMLTKVTLIF